MSRRELSRSPTHESNRCAAVVAGGCVRRRASAFVHGASLRVPVHTGGVTWEWCVRPHRSVL
jgi:hypothetical protein